MELLKPGDKAPDFTLPDHDGKPVSLKAYRGRTLLIYFYPKANTPGCTVQSCAVRDARSDFAAVGIDVIGISPDAPDKQKGFRDKYRLGFPLLSDADHAVADTFGVWGEKSLYGRKYMGVIRSAFLIGEDGRIVAAFYRISPGKTVPSIRKALRG